MQSPIRTLSDHDDHHKRMLESGLASIGIDTSMTWANNKTPAEFGVGQAWFSDIKAIGYSDSVNWCADLHQTMTGDAPFSVDVISYAPGLVIYTTNPNNYSCAHARNRTVRAVGIL